MLRPPFTAQDQESRVRLVTPQPLYCCRAQWDAATRSTLRDWLTSAGRPPAVALRWDEETGALFRLSEGEEPYLRSLLAVLAETDSPQALDRGLRELAGRLPPARPSPLTP